MRIVLAMTVLLAGSLSAYAQNLIRNGSFEEPQVTPGTGVVRIGLPSWTIVGADTAEVQRLFEGSQRNQDGNQWVELDGDANTSIYQDVPTVAGQRYLIRYRDAHRSQAPSSRIDILWNGALIGFSLPTSTTFRVVVGEAVAVGTVSRLGFRAAGASDGVGDLIDDIQLVPITATGALNGFNYYLGQFADGDVWQTTLTFVSDRAASVTYTAYDSGGTEIAGFSGQFSLAAFENRAVVGPGFSPTRIGWIRVQSTEPIGVNAVYRQRIAGRPDQEAAVLSREPTSRVLVPFDQSPGYATGIALANPGSARITVTIVARMTASPVTQTIVLNARSHTSFVLTERFPQAAGLKGTLTITAVDDSGLPAPFIPLGLRAQDSGAFATLPY